MLRRLRKGSVNVSVEFAGTYSHNLFADDFKYEVTPDSVRVYFSLERNLRTDAASIAYDARELADGIQRLEFVELSNKWIVGRVVIALKAEGTADPTAHVLEIALDGTTHRFAATAQARLPASISWRIDRFLPPAP